MRALFVKSHRRALEEGRRTPECESVGDLFSSVTTIQRNHPPVERLKLKYYEQKTSG